MEQRSESTKTGRRVFFRRVAMAGGVVSLLTGADTLRHGDGKYPLCAGVGVRDITPPLDVGILMSSGRQLWEPFEGVRLPLQARALVVEQEDRRIALVSLDLLGLAGKAVGGWSGFKRQVLTAADDVVTADDLVLASTHTHGGPESIALTDLFRTQAFKTWVGDLARSIGAAIKNAARSVRPCRPMVASRNAPELSVNRRIKTTRGIASVRQKLPPGVVIGPEGPVDDGVRVTAFIDPSDQPIAILVNFTAHPVLEMCIKKVSPDYPGEMNRELERRHPGTVAMFLQGACGNINPPTMERGAANSRRYGQRLAAIVHDAMSDLQPLDGDELGLRWKTVRLPRRDVHGLPESKPLEIRIGAARLGNAAFVFLPGEPFVEIALALRRASPWKFTAVVGYAEDYIGYIPTDRAFINGGYEIGPGRWSQVARGSESIVCRGAIELVSALKVP
ncbi:MAG: neutral/alkaline non-lysosomal ceramidase N-terminal domain-containing protein [Pirellulales bacterium]